MRFLKRNVTWLSLTYICDLLLILEWTLLFFLPSALGDNVYFTKVKLRYCVGSQGKDYLAWSC